MGVGWLGTWMVLALAQGPSASGDCRLEYEEVVGSATAIRSTTVAPSTTKTIGDVVLRIVNRAPRPLEVRLLPPAGPQATVTLYDLGATDPPALQYLGNWTLQSAHCPSAYPSAQHMWDAGGDLAAVRQEFQLSLQDAAVLLRNDYANVSALTWEAGAVPELMAAYPEQAWTPATAAALLHAVQYPAAAALHGLLRTSLLPDAAFAERMGQALSFTRQAGYPLAQVLEGSRIAVRTLEHWDKPTYEVWLDRMPAQTAYMLEAGFAYADVAQALVDVYDPTPKEFVDAFYYETWLARGSDASGRTARALESSLLLDEAQVALALLLRTRTSVVQGMSAQPPSVPELWQGTRDELRDGLYASPLQGCVWLGQATIQKWRDRPPPVGADAQALQSIRSEWNRVPDEDLDEVRANVHSDLAASAECFLGAGFSSARILAFAEARIPAVEHPRLAPGFRAHGVECGPLTDLLMANARSVDDAYLWIREAAYPDMRTCLDVLSARAGEFLMELYLAELGVGGASHAARAAGWRFEEVADAVGWFGASSPRFGPVARTYRVSVAQALDYLRSFARAQGREDVFDYSKYLTEHFEARVVCDAIQSADWGGRRAPACVPTRGVQ